MISLRGPELAFPRDATLADLVERQVDRTPDAVAVVADSGALTYAELDARANRLARALQQAGVGPDVPVALLLDRSTALVIALLAVLKSGGACLPLEPAHPPAWIAQLLADAGPPVVITDARRGAALGDWDGRVIELDRDADPYARHDSSRPPREAGPEDLAYVIYTSGSTGEPKGVMLPHRGLVNHNVAVARLYGLGPSDRVVQFCSVGFDVSVEEIFPTWETGATLLLRPGDVPILGEAWLRWLSSSGVTVLNLPTAYWHEWVRDLKRLGARVPECVRLVVVGGERALGAAYRTWLEVGGDRVRWLNAYGPAEASVLATAFEPTTGDLLGRPDPPIGRPLANTTVHVDDHGELSIEGAGVARGYLNRPDLTAERFVVDGDGTRRYRTGDLVRVLPGDNLEFVGRADQQVKVRGFRIECGEVESSLAGHPDVAEVAVVAREGEASDKRLVAYVVPRPAAVPTPAELRRFLAERLPRYMVPGAFVRIDALPVTPHGKLARDALPPPGDARRDLPTVWRAPGTLTERAVAALFSRTLGVAEVGADDDFFDLGGHSLQAMQVVAAIGQELGVHVGVSALLEGPTAALLAAAVDAAHPGAGAPALTARRRRPGERIPLSLSQEQMWRLETTADPPGLFNVTALHHFSGPVDVAALRLALAHVVARHEALRASFHVDADGPHQTVAAAVEVDVEVSEPAAGADPWAPVGAQDATPFDLARAPLLRAGLHPLDSTRSVVAVTFDHLVCDGTSAYVFLSELAAAYEAFVVGAQPALRPLEVQYPDFALWQRGAITEARLADQLAYWKDKLAGMPRGPTVPLDHRPQRPSRRIVACPVALGPVDYEGLRRLARATRSTVFVVTVAAVQALFSRAGDTTDVVLSTTLSGRQRAEVDGLVGCFHGVGRMRTDLSGNPSFTAIVDRTRETVVGLFEHQDLPFWRIRQAVLADFPAGGPGLLSAVPTELQYFHTAHDEWAPGRGVVERPGADKGPGELFFRGHMHPLNVTLLDDGTQLWGWFSYKVDFYDDATIERLAEGLVELARTVVADPGLRLSELP